MEAIRKFITNEHTYEVGDFFGGVEENNVITSIEMNGKQVEIRTDSDVHHLSLKGGEYLYMMDGTTQIVAKKGSEGLN